MVLVNASVCQRSRVKCIDAVRRTDALYPSWMIDSNERPIRFLLVKCVGASDLLPRVITLVYPTKPSVCRQAV